ncbi:MAG: hypothetical protein IPP14_08735 [Planctomycetes bacterium]|nr:hypothetical protein [Planctomycetota bacterium]
MRKFLPWLLLVGAALVAAAPVGQVQGQIRIVGGRSRPSSPGTGEPQPAAPAVPAVEPVEPTPEEALRISELIEQLGAPRLAQRDRAMAELAGFEARALRQVRQGKEHQEDEIANRCTVLEDVIQSRQAELFLAARRLSLEPSELERLLAAEDIKPLLGILKSRAQPGLTPLWAKVLGKLAVRPQVIVAAQLCMETEGPDGYGKSLAEASRTQVALPVQASALMGLVALLPPGSAADAVESLAFCGQMVGGAEGVQRALRTAGALRGLYAAADAMNAALRPEEPRRKLSPEGESLRQALALCMTPACLESDLQPAVSALSAMSPLVLAEYLSLLGRCGLNERVETALVVLTANGASSRALSAAGGAFAGTADIARLQAAFSGLPQPAQQGALDTLWLAPRDPVQTQAFLLSLLADKLPWLRRSAARMLGQYRARSTAKALAQAVLNDPEGAQYAIESLAPMADLLPKAAPTELVSLTALLTDANLSIRPALIDTLIKSGSADARKALMDSWKVLLARNELAQAAAVIGADTQTAVGAFAGVLGLGYERSERRDRYFAQLDNRPLILLRQLLAMSSDEGFALLGKLAADETSSLRQWVAAALALSDHDGPLIEDWIRRLAGETPDPQATALLVAVSLSRQPKAEEFRQRVLQQGSNSPHLQSVLIAVYTGRSINISREQMLAKLFETPATARRWINIFDILDGPMTPEAMKNIATALLFSEEIRPLDDPSLALLLADSTVDVLQLLYGDAADAAPRDASRTLLTALLGERDRAAQLVSRAVVSEDASNFQALQTARAWLGMLPAQESARALRMAEESLTWKVFLLRRNAQTGNAASLRALMDRFSSQAGRFAEGATAGLEIVTDRWRGSSAALTGVAGAAFGLEGTSRNLSVYRTQRFFAEAMPKDWDNWWQCRRALLQFDASDGKYRFLELP